MKPAKLTLDRITITAPRPSLQARGTNAGKTADPNRSIRISDTVYDSIKAAAEILGMTGAEFIKWTAYMSANEVHRIYRGQKAEQVAPIPTPEPIAKRVVKPLPSMPSFGKITRL